MAEQVRVVITAQDKTKQAIDSVDKNLQNLENSASELQGKATAAFAGLALAIGGAVKVSMDFEASMDRVAAVSQATSSQFKQLEATALEMGAETVYSATQASDALSYLAMAGFEVQQQVDAIPGVLSMAAAGMVDLAAAADIGSAILAGFNLNATEMNRVADVLTKGFVSTNTELVDLGEAMKFMAPVAAALGLSIEETTAAVGLLGNAGIKGGNAGRQMRSALNDLLKPSAEAEGLMKQLGISAVDSAGRFKDFADIVQNVKDATESMTDAQRAQTVATLMGSEGATAFLAIMQAGPEKLRALTKELENSGGTAERIATQQLDNLKGDLEVLKSQFEDTAIAVGDAFNPKVEAAASLLTDLLAGLSDTVRESPHVVTQFGLLATVSAGATVAVAALAKAFAGLMVSMGPIGWALAAVGAVGGVIANWAINARAARIEQEKQDIAITKLSADWERYDKVLTDSNSTAAEQAKAKEELKRITEELGDVMPELVTQWDSEGKAIEINTAKLKENTEAARENIRVKAENDRQGAYDKMIGAKDEVSRVEETIANEVAGRRGVFDRALQNGEINQATFNQLVAEDEQRIRDEWAKDLKTARDKFARATAEYAKILSKLQGPDMSEPWVEGMDGTVKAPPSKTATGTSGGGGTGAPDPDAFKKALANMDHLKRIGQLNGAAEISMLQEIGRVYARTEDEKREITERTYEANKALTEKDKADQEQRISGMLRLLDHRLRMNEIGTRGEIEELNRILETEKLTDEQRQQLLERRSDAQKRFASESAGALVKEQQEAAKTVEARVRNEIASINHRQRMGQLSREQELQALKDHLEKEAVYYRDHADERWSIDERIKGLQDQAFEDRLRKIREEKDAATAAQALALAQNDRALYDEEAKGDKADPAKSAELRKKALDLVRPALEAEKSALETLLKDTTLSAEQRAEVERELNSVKVELYRSDTDAHKIATEARTTAEKQAADKRKDIQSQLSKDLDSAEKKALEAAKARHKTEEDGLERLIKAKERELQQYERQIAIEDRLNKIQEANKRIADLQRSGEREQVLRADGTWETRISGMDEAQKALQDAEQEHERQTRRESLQDEITSLKAGLDALRETNRAKEEEISKSFDKARELLEEGFKKMETAQGSALENMARQLGIDLQKLLSPWRTYVGDVQSLLNSIKAPALPANEGTGAKTATAAPPPAPPANTTTPATAPAPTTNLPSWAQTGINAAMGLVIPELRVPTLPAGIGGTTNSSQVTFQPGSVVVQVDGQTASSPAQLGAAVERALGAATPSIIPAVQRGMARGRIQ